MPSASGSPTKLNLRWLPGAQQSFLHSLGRIGEQDPHFAELVLRRVRRALALLLLNPGLGTPTHRSDKRRFAIPNTGHFIEYRLVKDELRITRWMRQTRRRVD